MEQTILIFTLILIIAVFQSGWTRRTIYSNTVLFLGAGFVVGGILGWVEVSRDSELIYLAVEIALASVLFVGGSRMNLHTLRQYWRLPTRTLLFAMPLTFIFISIFAGVLFPISWKEALLIGAVLSPTDPVIVASVLNRDEIPSSVRWLLNIESGFNDGLALPVIIILLDLIHAEQLNTVWVLTQLVGGILIGIIVPSLILNLQRIETFAIAGVYKKLRIFAIGAFVFALAHFLKMNAFLAVFSAGITVSTIDPSAKDEFLELGEVVTELFKGFAIFVFGLLLFPSLFTTHGFLAYGFVLLVLLVARPVATWLVLIGTNLSKAEKITVAWFGPKGFASILYTLLVWRTGVPAAETVFNVLTLTLVISIVVHSMTDFWFTGYLPETQAE